MRPDILRIREASIKGTKETISKKGELAFVIMCNMN